ncbi:hypothetical protein VFA_002546 [Vibrio furnissii CIP 102972]|nr:hypothetical protein VFA_002546 [Vibrio furnissii CIP 102972]
MYWSKSVLFGVSVMLCASLCYSIATRLLNQLPEFVRISDQNL